MTESLPDRYWHAEVTFGTTGRSNEHRAVCFDKTLAEIVNEIAKPIVEGRDAIVGGTIVPYGNLHNVRVLHSIQSSTEVRSDFSEALKFTAFREASEDGRLLTIWQGTERTDVILAEARKANEMPGAESTSDLEIIRRACSRLVQAALMLTDRRKGAAPYTIANEYDAQDLLQAIIKAYTPFSIVEEPVSKLCGITGSRADIAMESLGLIIEVKYAREGELKALFQQIRDDVLLYARWPHLAHLMFVIYNSTALKDAELLQTLPKHFSADAVAYSVEVILL